MQDGGGARTGRWRWGSALGLARGTCPASPASPTCQLWLCPSLLGVPACPQPWQEQVSSRSGWLCLGRGSGFIVMMADKGGS